MLPAFKGDFFWIRYRIGNIGPWRHVLIDSGCTGCWRDYISILECISNNGEVIEALFLTHIDEDHIGGALKAFANISKPLPQIERIYLNTGRGIARHMSLRASPFYPEDELSVAPDDGFYSVSQAFGFLELLKKYGLESKLLNYTTIDTTMLSLADGAIIRFISPSEDALLNFYSFWEKDRTHVVEGYSVSGEISFESADLSSLFDVSLGKDTSVSNGSSIAFLFSFEGKCLAFLADAHADICARGLKKIGYSLACPCPVDFVKLSHHGSNNNLSEELLQLLPTQNYIVSTNGSHRKFPSKIVLAKLLKFNHNKHPVHLFYNYRWTDHYFTSNDYTYLQKKKLILHYMSLGNDSIYDVTNQKPFRIKEGLNLYGTK
jgi:hypothetical protein